VNGVWRGCSYSAPVTFRARSGFRWGDNTVKKNGNASVGFRLNGVYRGSQFNIVGSNYTRCSFRRGVYGMEWIAPSIGFRLLSL